MGLYGRYVLELQIKVTLDSTRAKITDYKEPKFFLVEYAQVFKLADGSGRWASITGPTHAQFGNEAWSKIVEKGGDLSVLNVPIKKDDPIPDFDHVWRARGAFQ